jgi:hypothetical protein
MSLFQELEAEIESEDEFDKDEFEGVEPKKEMWKPTVLETKQQSGRLYHRHSSNLKFCTYISLEQRFQKQKQQPLELSMLK